MMLSSDWLSDTLKSRRDGEREKDAGEKELLQIAEVCRWVPAINRAILGGNPNVLVCSSGSYN